MSKKQGDFVVYTRNKVAINAVVAFSRQVLTSEGSTEHLTIVYLDPAAASIAPTGEQLRNSIKIQPDVPPLAENAVNGWDEIGEDRINGSPREVVEAVQFGAASEEIAKLRKALADSENEAKAQSLTIANLEQKNADAANATAANEAKIVSESKPSSADLDAHAADAVAKEATEAK